MANTFRIKRRAQGGGAGAPTTLANAELAFNEQTDILYYGEGTGGEGGTATQVLPIGGSGAFVDLSSNQEVGGTKTFTASPIVPTPTTDTQAANKGYVDAVARGLDWKPSVRVATGSNITLSGTQTIDGKAVVAGDRVLVRAQTTASANGIYVVASGAWTRATDFSATGGPGGASSATAGATVFVSEGTTYGNTSWTCTTDDPITVGTTPVTFAQVAGSGSEATAANVGTSGTGVYYGASGNELQFRKLAAGSGVSITTANPDNGTLTVAVGSDVVRTTGSQSIAGEKSFSDTVSFTSASQFGASVFGTVSTNAGHYLGQLATFAGAEGITVFGNAMVYGDIDMVGAGHKMYLRDSDLDLGKDPTSGNHATRKSWVDTQLAEKQAADATLTALAGVTVAADQLIYSTGADAFSVTGLTAAGRALLDDADAAAQRTTLGLAIGTNVQAYDAGLNSIAGLTTAANKMIYTTAADTYAVADLSSFARTILDDADATAARSTLGLTIGTNVQAYDATLTALAGVTTAANKLIYATGADTFTTTDLSSFGRSLIDDANATAARSTLGLDTMATQAASNVNITGGAIDGITLDGGTF